jgi:hypothetical protein
MTTIVIDGLNEESFRRSIENRLREGRAGAAIARLRAQLAPYTGPGGILPERLLTIGTADLTLIGWDTLGDAVRQHDRPGHPVTALSIAFGWPGEEAPLPDAEGCLRPYVETSYFTDEAFPFSQSAREDLLEGYSAYGCNWSGDAEATDTALSLDGIDDLYGALATLEARLLASDEPDEDVLRAGSLGSCMLSALLVQAVSEQIARDGLPRPLCVMAGSNNVYPYFDAPVVGMPEEPRKAAEVQEVRDEVDHGVPVPRYSSLLMTGIPRARKRAVLVLNESEDELANRIAGLRSLNHPDSEHEVTRPEALPVVPAPEQAEPVMAAVRIGPLLAKKPAREAWDFREMLSPPQPEPPTIRCEPPEQQGSESFESDVQQRLQRLLAAHPQPAAKVPALAPPRPADQSELDWACGPGWLEDDHAAIAQAALPADTIAQLGLSGLWTRLRARFRGQVKAGLARFGL